MACPNVQSYMPAHTTRLQQGFVIRRKTNLRCKNVEPPMSQMGQTPHRPQLRGDLIHDKTVRWPHQKNLVVGFDVFEPLQPVYARYGLGQPMQILRLIE